jgi:hypothetical protein
VEHVQTGVLQDVEYAVKKLLQLILREHLEAHPVV